MYKYREIWDTQTLYFSNISNGIKFLFLYCVVYVIEIGEWIHFRQCFHIYLFYYIISFINTKEKNIQLIRCSFFHMFIWFTTNIHVLITNYIFYSASFPLSSTILDSFHFHCKKQCNEKKKFQKFMGYF